MSTLDIIVVSVPERHQLKRSLQQGLFRWPACACALAAIVFSVLIGSHANAFEYDQRYALLIGLGKYEQGRNKGFFRNLELVVNDLETVANALREIDFDQIDIYSDLDPQSTGGDVDYKKLLFFGENVLTPIRAEHIRKIIRDKLDYFESLEKSELDMPKKRLLLVYFTGHGGLIGRADRVLATPDSDVNDPESFPRVYKLLDDLTARAPTVDKMLVIDACADDLIKNVEYSITRYDEELPAYVYSSGLHEASFFDKKLRKSIFTHYFAQALQQADRFGHGDNNGTIDSDEIIEYVKEMVPNHPEKEQKKDPSVIKLSPVQHPRGSSGKSRIDLGLSK